jgi:hypothetical protein
MMQNAFHVVVAALLIVLTSGQSADASVVVVDLTPAAMADAKISSVIRVSISSEPDASGAYEVSVSGPIAEKVNVRGLLRIGSDAKLRLNSPVAVDQDDRNAKDRDGQKTWSISFKVDRALASDAVLHVQRDSGPLGTRYQIPLKLFMPVPK